MSHVSALYDANIYACVDMQIPRTYTCKVVINILLTKKVCATQIDTHLTHRENEYPVPISMAL